jgi:hypothetical protein
MTDHFYTTDPNGEAAPKAGYQKEGIACYVKTSASGPNWIPLYRWFHPGTGDHFYTTDPNGEAAPKVGYQKEGIACYVLKPGTYGQDWASGPMHRWYNSKTNDHFYTTDKNGEAAPQAGYHKEGEPFWVVVSPGVNTPGQFAPLYRWFHP